MTYPPSFAAAQQRIIARRAQTAQNAPSITTIPAAVLALPAPLRELYASIQPLATAFTSRTGTTATFRVGQLDASLLDNELLSLLTSQARSGLRFFPSLSSDTDYIAELDALLRLALWKLSVWNHNASYGATLQGLRYIDARSHSRGTSRVPSTAQKLTHALLTVGVPYAWRKWEDFLLDAPSSADDDPARTRKLDGARTLTRWGTATHDIATLVSFSIFLLNGRYRSLSDRVLRMRLVPASAQTAREVSFEYLNRQLVWHAFTEFLLFVLPLVGVARWRRWLARAWRKIKALVAGRSRADGDDAGVKRGELAFLPERTCAICFRGQNPGVMDVDGMMLGDVGGGGVQGSALTDVTNPYEALPCGDVYCFACLAQRIEAEEGEGWTCLRCGEIVKECRPWSGDVIVEEREGPPRAGDGTRKSVIFVDGTGRGYETDEEAEGSMSPLDPMPIDDEADMVGSDDDADALIDSKEWNGSEDE